MISSDPSSLRASLREFCRRCKSKRRIHSEKPLRRPETRCPGLSSRDPKAVLRERASSTRRRRITIPCDGGGCRRTIPARGSVDNVRLGNTQNQASARLVWLSRLATDARCPRPTPSGRETEWRRTPGSACWRTPAAAPPGERGSLAHALGRHARMGKALLLGGVGDEPPHPVHARALGAIRIMASPQTRPQLVQRRQEIRIAGGNRLASHDQVRSTGQVRAGPGFTRSRFGREPRRREQGNHP